MMIYIHIPFCKQRCIYCDFHSGTDFALQASYVDALCKELRGRKDYVEGDIRTIYLGGGTPSLLSEVELRKIFDCISQHFSLEKLEEVTIECNPDDVNEEFLGVLRKTPINRISIGIQSFNDGELKWLNRRHSAAQAIEAVRMCRAAGFDNISIDLMFSLPGQTLESWGRTLDVAMGLGVEHISCYTLMYEESSRLTKMYNEGKIEPIGEEESEEMFKMLIKAARENGFEQYEISNFCREGRASLHNSGYWKMVSYLGVGASAHSFDGKGRRENVSNTRVYVNKVLSGEEDYYDCEVIEGDTLFNEYMFTALRTKEGVCIADVEERFGGERLKYVLDVAGRFIRDGLMEERDGMLALTERGIYVSDAVMSDFMVV